MTESATQMMPFTGVLEAAIYCRDLEAARRFYGDLLGMEEVTAIEGRHVFFRCGNTMVLVFNPEETAKQPFDTKVPIPAHGAVGAGHICFTVQSERLAEAEALLNKKGVTIETAFNWPNGARSVYFRDPCGNSVEFSEPRLWGFEERAGNA